MHRSRALVSLFLLTMLILTACQSGSTPETITSPAPTNPPPTEPPPTSTLPPTAIPTETAVEITLEPGQCVQLLENGDFETSSITPWVETSNQNNMLIGNFHGRNGAGYHAVLGTNNGADESVSQEFTIPVNAATVTLSYWWSMGFRGSDKTTVQDILTASLEDQTGKALETLAEYNNTTPVMDNMVFYEASHDLTAYTGQAVRLTFHSVLDAQDQTEFFVDDVIAEACGPAPEVAVATQPPTTAAPTAAALGKGECVELIQNGDFETGSIAPWIETQKFKPTLLTEVPARGKFGGFLGGGSGIEEALAQDIEIPSSAANVTLTYWWMHGGRETDGKAHDFLKVILQDPTGKELAILEEISNITPPDREFAESTQDLTGYIGQSARLVFHVITDAQNDSDFFVDDISMQACGPK